MPHRYWKDPAWASLWTYTRAPIQRRQLDMEYRSLGRSGLKVPVLCLGAMTFGEADDKSFMHKVGCDEKTSYAIMSRALERGAAFIDTADVYGQDGLSERVVGAWMAEAKARD